MRNSIIYSVAKTSLLFAFVLVLTSSLFAQSESKNESIVSVSNSAAHRVAHSSVAIKVRLDSVATESASGQVTLSGYVEDLPTP